MTGQHPGGPPGGRLAVEAATAGLAFGSVLWWASTCLVGSFRGQGLADPYWHGIPWLRTDTSGFIMFLIAAACLTTSEYLRLRRRRDFGRTLAAQSDMAARDAPQDNVALMVLAASETVAVLATGLVIYLSFNAVIHPGSLQLPITRLLSWPAEGTVRVISLLLCACSVAVIRYHRALGHGR